MKLSSPFFKHIFFDPIRQHSTCKHKNISFRTYFKMHISNLLSSRGERGYFPICVSVVLCITCFQWQSTHTQRCSFSQHVSLEMTTQIIEMRAIANFFAWIRKCNKIMQIAMKMLCLQVECHAIGSKKLCLKNGDHSFLLSTLRMIGLDQGQNMVFK